MRRGIPVFCRQTSDPCLRRARPRNDFSLTRPVTPTALCFSALFPKAGQFQSGGLADSTTLLSLAEHQGLSDNGTLREFSEVELIVMPPPDNLHSHVAHRFFRVLDVLYLSSQPVSAKGRSPSASQSPGAALPGFRLREAWRRSHSRAGGDCRTAGGQESTAVTRRIETAPGTSIQPQSAVKETSAGSGWPPGTARRGRRTPRS